MKAKIDQIDHRIIDLLQRNGNLSQREVAEQVGLSQNACWRRMKRLSEIGILRGTRAVVDAAALGLDLTIFVMIKTRNHSMDWSDRFRAHVESIPQVVELHRIGGDWDYMLKIVTDGMAGYDRVYRQLITGFELDNVTGFFSMEPIFSDRPLALPN
ncbi:Lrp/AsnC family transcriptional regulator [Alisedimentitalea sp. MJ-SS2]|uniref:Lrp/AsnC family transcriptional regulator n=1 Tax=Aliisedimentitalea sp. MJ-SS2 TaxID=3049795 RepID=UPI00290A6E23|nr:Lrp/AsnC family transcriptional regulator [Alisedimentitalea sp. MJ-SS2]MDU8926581.1 Lrp/AsnC family transcriptional regulator [Alisedimentitalea sp. MJ-SS2]